MIKTKFDDRFREIPIDIATLEKARQNIQKDFPTALNALEDDPSELDKIDYYRLLSRASDLDRFELNYTKAFEGFEKTSLFWKSIGWKKAAFLCDLKAALCWGYTNEENERFSALLPPLKEEAELSIYELFFYQFRGQIFVFHGDKIAAENDFRRALKMSVDNAKRKQIDRFNYFLEGILD